MKAKDIIDKLNANLEATVCFEVPGLCMNIDAATVFASSVNKTHSEIVLRPSAGDAAYLKEKTIREARKD